MGLRVPAPVARPCLNVPAAGSASTTRPTSTTPAASPWSRKLDGEPSHETVAARDRRAREPRAPRRRGRRSRTPATAPGSCSSCPTSSCAGVIDEDLPPPGRLRRLRLLPARGTRSAAPSSSALLERHGRGRGPARRRLARRAGRQGLRRHHRQPLRALRQAARRGRVRRARGRPGRVRAQALRDPPRGRDRRRPGARDPELQQPHDRLQGHAHRARSCSATTPTCRTRATKSALALVHSRFSHQHVPELGARAPVPDDRPQRRDQHAARQRQLDARARVAARLRAVRRRPAEGPAGRAPRRLATPRRSTTCSSCSCWPAAACRTR